MAEIFLLYIVLYHFLKYFIKKSSQIDIKKLRILKEKFIIVYAQHFFKFNVMNGISNVILNMDKETS